jgi:hypothetical protein
MDDVKLTGKTEEELQKYMQIVRTFTDNIHMEFGLDNCAKIVLKKGKLVHSQNLTSTKKHKRLNRDKHTDT